MVSKLNWGKYPMFCIKSDQSLITKCTPLLVIVKERICATCIYWKFGNNRLKNKKVMAKNVKSDDFFSTLSRQFRKIAVETLSLFLLYFPHFWINFQVDFMQQTFLWSLNYLLTHIPPPPPPINVAGPNDRGDELAPSNIEQGGWGRISARPSKVFQQYFLGLSGAIEEYWI